jgi:hypothetical protein
MRQERTPPLWPFGIAVLIAFSMSITAPRRWERVAQRTALAPAKPSLHRASDDAIDYDESDGTAAETDPLFDPFAGPPRLPAIPQGRIAAEFPTVATASLSQVLPTLAPPRPAAVGPTSIATHAATSVTSIPAVAPVAAPVEEPPSLDRPRLSGGLRYAATPIMVAGAPTVQPAIVVPTAPVLQPTLAPRQPSEAPSVAVTAPAAPQTVPVIAPAVAPEVPARPASWWPMPVDLTERLDALLESRPTHVWAARTSATLARLLDTPELTSAKAAELVADLRRATAESLAIDELALDSATAVNLRLARHALVRRLDVWESLKEVVSGGESTRDSQIAEGTQRLETCLVEIGEQTAAAGETGLEWRQYLMLDALQGACGPADVERRQQLAREVLGRLRRARATPEPHDFLHEGPFADLDASLRLLADEDVDPQQLLIGLERFEQGGLPSDSHALAAECARLTDSTDEAKRQLAVWLTSHYRNANVRITFSPDFVNRMLPDALKRSGPVNDTILGNVTRGWSTTRTGLKVGLVPHPDHIAVRLSAEGETHSQTRTYSGSVQLFSQNNAKFLAEKDIELTTDGFNVQPAKAAARGNSRLRGIESNFDGMPILNSIVTSIARGQADEKKPAAQREADWKMSQQVQRNIDGEIEKYLKAGDAQLEARVLVPLGRLGVAPEIIDLHSTENRAAVRLRVAGDDQLAANTPRPRAYSDNLGSIQIHQSAANNVLDRLGLAGRRFTPVELYHYVVERLNLTGGGDLSQLPPDMSLKFAATDPLTIRFDDGKLELRIAVEEMTHGERIWRNFTIRAPLRPEKIDGVTYFVRDDVVRISGPQIGATAQISLRTVFAKVFPEDFRVRLWPERLENDPRFADLDIEQVDIRDGWIGVAVGPKRQDFDTARLPRGVRQ